MGRKLLSELISTLIIIIIVMIAASLLFMLAGINPIEAIRLIIYGALGRTRGISESLIRAIPITLIGLSVTIAFRAGLWNVGGQGQFYAGAIGASFIALFFPMTRIIHLPLLFIAAFITGGIYAGIAGFLRAYMRVNEILSTLMLNFITLWLTQYLATGPWSDPGRIIVATAFFPDSARLNRLHDTVRVHQGLYLALLCVGIVFVILNYTVYGQKLKVLGANLTAAKYAKINIKKKIVTIFLLSGGFAGLAGAVEVSGVYYCLRNGAFPIEAGYGFIGIGAALMGMLTPVGTLISAVFFGILIAGSSYLKTVVDLHGHTVNFIIGLLIIGMVARHLFRPKIQKFLDKVLFGKKELTERGTSSGS